MTIIFGVSLELVLFCFLPENYFTTFYTEDIVSCSHKCMYNRGCQAMVFDIEAQMCYLYNEWILTNPTGVNTINYIIYNANRGEECSPPGTVCPTDRGFTYVQPPVDVCYKLHTDQLPNPDADESCKQEGARGLLQLDTSDKMEHFKNMIPQYQYTHVSGYLEPNNVWMYPPGDNPTAPPCLDWAPGQPNNPTEQHCLAVDAAGIHDAFCDSRASFPYICGM